MITEGPDRIEDPHDARHIQHDGREHYPPFTTPIMVFPFSRCGISAPVRHGYTDSPNRLGASSPFWGVIPARPLVMGHLPGLMTQAQPSGILTHR